MNYAAATTWLKSRSNLPTVKGSAELGVELDAAVKARSFFSAKVAEAHILDKLRDVSDRFSAGTIDRASARAELKTWLSGQGYRPNDVAAVPPDGVKFKDWDRNNAITNLASTARLDLVLDQNARMAAAVGQYQVGMDPDIAERWPNWRYITGPNPRDEHARLNGFVAKKSDPVWSRIFPPWAFRCNCSVEDCDDEEAAQYGGVKESVNGKIDNNGFIDVSGPSADGFTFNPADGLSVCDMASIKNPEMRQQVHSALVSMAQNENCGLTLRGVGAMRHGELTVNAPDNIDQIRMALKQVHDAVLAKTELPALSVSLGRLLPQHAEALGISAEDTALALTSPGTAKYGVNHWKQHHGDTLDPEKAIELLERTVWNTASAVSEQIAGKKVHRLIFKEQSGTAIASFWRHGKSWELDIIDTWEPGESYAKIKN